MFFRISNRNEEHSYQKKSTWRVEEWLESGCWSGTERHWSLFYIADLPMITALQELRSAEELKHRKEAAAASHLSSVQSTPEKPRASSTVASDPLLHTPATPSSGMWYVCCVLSYTITLHNLKTFCQCCLNCSHPQSLEPSTTASPSKTAAEAATSPSSADKDKEKLREWEAKMEQERQEAERRYSVFIDCYRVLFIVSINVSNFVPTGCILPQF